mmetsp:Transcript_15805/g.36266  ORF Transcript_15805/g.36266 Transcript_15805/m.36266 type:complete len:105 (-) Transcript_15805:170-484(-)
MLQRVPGHPGFENDTRITVGIAQEPARTLIWKPLGIEIVERDPNRATEFLESRLCVDSHSPRFAFPWRENGGLSLMSSAFDEMYRGLLYSSSISDRKTISTALA